MFEPTQDAAFADTPCLPNSSNWLKTDAPISTTAHGPVISAIQLYKNSPIGIKIAPSIEYGTRNSGLPWL
ncbi:hypothetical protein BTUL_0085g00100 [Botrytis tulipae]|uniref:Uncharacterized protein n=1 Tax=Botrytis tulipae TaxID=87230 RepID=A0A4Z1EM16_9HELO|nr:hypothetical protein BTUL_0085g00100 [Botrytis tulipae]